MFVAERIYMAEGRDLRLIGRIPEGVAQGAQLVAFDRDSGRRGLFAVRADESSLAEVTATLDGPAPGQSKAVWELSVLADGGEQPVKASPGMRPGHKGTLEIFVSLPVAEKSSPWRTNWGEARSATPFMAATMPVRRASSAS